ncbi:MAG TPA: PEP-CTERM/exosortase system-associated acyltransferase [Gammaproteobacteria bacterium]|nr:PEP-CTERM/exosortase system-associated acyltransferase [Gammaproteobacteria bacterium]
MINASVTPSLTHAFHHYFRVVAADSPALQARVHRIRYQVYCEELRYERAEDFADGFERDAFDARSRHCLLWHTPSQQYAGCVRLVMTDPEEPGALLPFESCCRASLHDWVQDTVLPRRGTFGEISRLAVPSSFRRRKGDSTLPGGEAGPSTGDAGGHRQFPYIAVGLYLAAAAIGLEAGLDGVFAMMEPRLARHLRRFGFEFRQAGDVVDYHGERAAFYITRERLFRHLDPEMRALLDDIRHDLAATGGA